MSQLFVSNNVLVLQKSLVYADHKNEPQGPHPTPNPHNPPKWTDHTFRSSGLVKNLEFILTVPFPPSLCSPFQHIRKHHLFSFWKKPEICPCSSTTTNTTLQGISLSARDCSHVLWNGLSSSTVLFAVIFDKHKPTHGAPAALGLKSQLLAKYCRALPVNHLQPTSPIAGHPSLSLPTLQQHEPLFCCWKLLTSSLASGSLYSRSPC